MLTRLRLLIIPGVAAAAIAGVSPVFADFVCPVLPADDNAVQNSSAGFIQIAGGDTSILPGKAGDQAESPVSVPDGATNMDGAGSPAGAHAGPGDPGYTAIWNTD